MARPDNQELVFRALADRTRREILRLLGKGPGPVQELASHFPKMSRPAVSKHLRILREAGLVVESREGRRRIYRAETGPLRFVVEWLGKLGAEEPASRRVATPPRRRRAVATPRAARSARPGPASRARQEDWRSW